MIANYDPVTGKNDMRTNAGCFGNLGILRQRTVLTYINHPAAHAEE
jgi:hypothetical protein